MNNDNLKGLHGTLIKEGYNPPEYEQFAKDMEDETNLQGVYETLKREGYTPPSYDIFKEDMGFAAQPDQSSGMPESSGKPANGFVSEAVPQDGTAPIVDQGLVDAAQAGANLVQRNIDQPKLENTPGTDEWRARTVDIPGENPYNGQTYGAVYDSIIQDFGKNLNHPDIDPYAEARAQIMQAGITDELNPAEADNLALQIREGYANKYAQGEAKDIISSLPDHVPDIDNLMDGLWYNRGLQDKIAHEARRLGLRQENYINYFMKPQLAKALSERYGYDVESAKHIASRLMSQDQHVMERVRQNEAADMIGQYAEPEIQKYFDQAIARADQEYLASPKSVAMSPESKVGMELTAAINKYQSADPAKIWEQIKPNIEKIGDSIAQNPEFLAEAMNHAEEEGVETTQWIENRIIPMLESQLQAKFEQMAIEREMPKNTMDYLWQNIQQSLIGTVTRMALESQARQRMKAEALQRTEMGRNQNYTPSFGARIGGGAASMLPDMALPFGGPFGIVGRYASSPVRGTAQELIAEGMRPLLARIAESSLSGMANLGAFEGIKGAFEGGLIPVDQESFLEDNRSAGEVMKDIINGFAERGISSAIAGSTMIGHPIANKLVNGRGALANALGWIGGSAIDAAGATTLNTVPGIIFGDITLEDVGKDFASNLGTFMALGLHGKAKEFASLAKGGKAWNGVEFTKSDIETLEDRFLMPLRKQVEEIEKAQNKKGLISKRINGDDTNDAINLIGTTMYNDLMRSYAVPRDLKAKVAQALGMDVPEYAMKPQVIDLFNQVRNKTVGIGMEDAMNFDYNKQGGVADKLMNGEALNNYELTLRLLFQDNKAFNEALIKQRNGEPLTEQEQELIAVNTSRLQQLQNDYRNQETNRIISIFERNNNMEPGSLRKMLADVSEGKAVDSNLLNDFEQMLKNYNDGLDLLREAQQTRQQQVSEEAPAEEIPKVNMVAGNAAEEKAVGNQAARNNPNTPPVNQATGTVMEVQTIDGRKAYVVEGEPTNPEGLLSLVDEQGNPIKLTDQSGYTIDRFPSSYIQADKNGRPMVKETKPEAKEKAQPSGNAPNQNEKNPGERTQAIYRIPLDKDGEPMYESAKAEDTFDALAEELGEEYAAALIESMISDAEKRIPKPRPVQPVTIPNGISAAEKVRLIKQQISRQKAQQEEDRKAAEKEQATADYWKSVLDVQKTRQAEAERIKAEEAARLAEAERRQKMQTPEGRLELLGEARNTQERTKAAKDIYGDYFNENIGEPDTAEELVSLLLPYGRLNWEGYDRGITHVRGLQEELGSQHTRGLSKDKGTAGFNSYLAKKGEGESLETIAHEIYESDANLSGDDHRFTTEEIRNAAIDLLLSAEKPTDIRDFTLNSRIEMAEKMLKGEMDHAEENYINGRKNETGQEVGLDNTGGEAGRDRQDGQVEIQAQGAEGAAGADTQQPKVEGTEAGTGVPPVSAADVSGGASGVANTGGLPFEGPSDGDAPFLKVSADDNSFAGRLTRAKQQTNTEPTDAQKEKGNYRKGHVSFGGYDFVVENPEGSFRRGKDKTGRSWEQQMHNTYGYILGKKGKDGDHLDMFINDAQDLDGWNGKVYVIDQVDPGTGKFDEHKIMYGFGSEAEARDAYLSNYEDGWKGLGRITGVDKDTFDKWLDSSDRKIKEFAEHSITRDAIARQEPGEKKPVADAEIDKALMNEVMKEPASKGVEFITDTDEGQRVLDEANGSVQVKKMGQKTNKKKAQIAADLEGNELTPEQQAVVDVFTGKSNNSTLSFTRDGKQRRVIMRKGNEVRAGAEHSLFRHYGTTEGVISSEDVLRIPGVLATGERTPVKRGKTQLYEYTLTDTNGVKYTVVTENKHGREEFADFYTNKKGDISRTSTPSEEARAIDTDNALSGAKVQQNSETAKDSERKFFKTPDGHAYGYTYKGKIYIDPRIATSETPIHEYGHLWAEMKRQTSPEEWNRIKDVLLNDRLIEPFIEKVRRDYPELEGREDDFVEEVLTQFSGRHGAEKLRRMAQEIKEELGGNATAETIAETAVRRVKSLLNDFWKGVCDLMGWQYTSAEDIADAVLRDMLNGVNPRERMKEGAGGKNDFAARHGIDESLIREYEDGIKEENLGKAARAFTDIRRTLRMANKDKKLSEFTELFAPIREEMFRQFGNIDALREKQAREAETRAGVMEAARKREEEARAKESERMKELEDMTDEQLDDAYMKALDANDENRMRDIINVMGDRRGYTDASDYQGEGAWKAPGNPGYESDEARRADVESNSPDVNVADIANGYSPQPKDYFLNPRAYGYDNRHGRESAGAINKAMAKIATGGRGVTVKVYRAVPENVEEGTFRNGDWVTPSRAYAEMHGKNRLEGKYRIIEQEVPADHLWWDGNDINEWGYDDGSGYRYKNTENSRKLNDLVTRDDEGNVIPPSRRFDEANPDVRFQKQAKEDDHVQAIYDKGTDVEYDNGKGRKLTMRIHTPASEIEQMKPTNIEAHTLSRDEQKKLYQSFEPETNDSTGETVEFYNSAFGKNHREGGLFEKIVPQIRELFKESKLIYSEKEQLSGTQRKDGTTHKRHDDLTGFGNYLNRVTIDGKDYYVRFTVQRKKGESGLHSSFVSNVELYENPARAASDPSSNGGRMLDFDRISDAKLRLYFEKSKELSEKVLSGAQENEKATNNTGAYDPGNPDIRYQRVGSPEPELTPEERQYWNKWDQAMKKWKEQNAIPEDAEEPGEETPKQPDEDTMSYVMRTARHRIEKAKWKTAPRLEDFRQARSDKDTVELARENLQRYPDSVQAKMRLAAAEFQQIRSAMGRQKAYDKATVKAVTDFAQDYMRMGFGDNLGRGEIERMLSSVKNATGAKDIRREVDNIMNILTDNYLRNLENQVTKLSSTKELSKTAQGVEKQGRLELKGQRMIKAFREAREYRMTAEDIRNRMAAVAEKMNRSDEEAPMWEQEYEGLSIALQYAENIEGSRSEWADLDREYKDAVKEYKASGRSYKAQQELLESIDKAMMENKLERIGLYGEVIGRLQGNISESMQGAREFVERQKQRQKHIWDMANFDLAGKDMGAMREKSKGRPANFFLQPLGTFEQMLRQFGGRNASGEGRLYNYFMRSWMDATDRAFKGEQKAKGELDGKAREVFGDSIKRWSDLYRLTRNEKDFPGMDVEVLDQGEPKTFHLTQGNLLYIYMANKMNDGRMKLRNMDITDEDVEAIREHLDPRLVQLGDWLQEEYLPQKRTGYNKVHERMFGAPMAAIDHYFPIRVLDDARHQEQDVNVPDSETLPSTITGNIIKRTKNTLPLDILHTDALSLAIEHIEDMEHWAAQAEWNKDVNTLLSYTTFRNKVKNMKTIYGSGDALWNAFKDAAKMAAGTYSPSAKSGHVDKAISNIAKGVTAAKINFRVYTAFKQLLSAPAFLHDVDIDKFVKNSVNPYGSWKWAMENMPVFEKRWKSRQAGDTRLMDDPTDWKMWRSNIVQMATRMGMSPNAWVDGITCAVGARSIYESRLKKYKDIGMDETAAEKRAMQDAEIGYNLTQQSSEGAFVSAIQKDRTVAANMLSVFRNSSMAYTRQWVDAARNLRHRMQPGYREDSIGFMTRQFEDELGLDHDQAQEAAEKEYARAGRHELAKMLNMMFGVTVAWNLGASLPYLLIGDDNETKKEMMTDALMKGLLAGPAEGLAAGNIISDFVGQATNDGVRKAFKEGGMWEGGKQALKNMGEEDINPLPLFADIDRMIGKMKNDGWVAAQEVFNIVMQSAVGVNPQTFTDMWNAVMDYAAPAWDGTDYKYNPENMAKAKELALFIMRVMNAPISSWRNKYIDELGMGAEEAQKLSYDEMALRYAHYKHWTDAPVTGWLRGDEARQKKMEKIRKQFDKAVEERIGRLSDEDLQKAYENTDDKSFMDLIGKNIGKRVGGKDVTGKSTSKKPEVQAAVGYYTRNRTGADLMDDLQLEAFRRKVTAHTNDGTVTQKELDVVQELGDVVKRIRKERDKMTPDGDNEEHWRKIRQMRDEILEKIRSAESE